MMTILRQSLIAAGLSLPKTTGTRRVVRRPNNSIITPRTADPDIQAEKQEKNDMKLTDKLKKQAGITNENAGKVK